MDKGKLQLWTVLDVIRWATEHFEKHEVDSPRLTIELMLCEVLKCERVQLYLNFERLMHKDELAQVRVMIERRVRDREPLQYILGHTYFYGYRFTVGPSVLIPRPETELLVDWSIKYIKSQPQCKTVLDIGTGCGCIGIAIAKQLPLVSVTGVDKSNDALETALLNAARNSVTNIRFEQRDILEQYTFGERFDVVVSNPPYISLEVMNELTPEVNQHEPLEALTDNHDGLLFYRHFARVLRTILKPGGKFFLEIGFGQAEAMRSIFCDYYIDILEDFSKIPRIVVGTV